MLGEVTAGLSSLAPGPCLLSPEALLQQGRAALGKGGKGVIIALETFQNQEGDSGAARQGWGGTPLPPRASFLCPAQRWTPWACSCRTTQSPREWGATGAEGVRSPRVIANSKEGRGWRRRGKVRTLLGRRASKTP